MTARNVLCRTFPVQRQLGQNAVAGAAYRAGENLVERSRSADEKDRLHRYAGRSVTVREAMILIPDGAPSWASDRAELWNRVEESETRKNARVGREVQLGLAYELGHDEQRALLAEFAEREFISKGFAVDIAIHNYGRTIPAIGAEGEQHASIRDWAQAGVPFLERGEAEGFGREHVLILRSRAGEVTGYKHYQPHAHLRIPPRPFESGAFAGNKAASREFDRHETAMRWRYEWPKLQNGYLEQAGSEIRVRSTSAEEERFPDAPRLAEGGDDRIHAIEQRAHELDAASREKHEAAKRVEEMDQAFRAFHNSNVLMAYQDARAEASDETARVEREQVRQAAWWRNVSIYISRWREEFREQVGIWRDRIVKQAERVASLIGWRIKAYDSGGGGAPRDESTQDGHDGQDRD